MRVKLRDAVQATKTVSYTKKPILYADKCAACDSLYKMLPFSGGDCVGQLEGTFSKCAKDPETGRGLGNHFSTTVCSFQCAHKIITGGWKSIAEYQPYAEIDAILGRASVKITPYLRTERDLLADWEEKNHQDGHRVISSFGIDVWGRPSPKDINTGNIISPANTLTDEEHQTLMETLEFNRSKLSNVLGKKYQ